MIQVKNLCKKYTMESGEVLANNNISFDFNKNGLYMILGKSGCGKTTLLNILSGLDSFDSGEVYVNGEELFSYSEESLDKYHNLNMGIVFQEFNLISELSVYDNLRIALEIQEWTGKNSHEIELVINNTLEIVGLKGYGRRKISELSGGERQRIAIARVLVKEPKIIFADEPTGNLDSNTSRRIFELLKKLSKEYVVIVVTHDKEFSYRYADVVIHMDNGCIEEIKYQDVSKYSKRYSALIRQNKSKMSFESMSYEDFCKKIMDVLEMTLNREKLQIENVRIEDDIVEETYETMTISCRQNRSIKRLPYKYLLKLALQFIGKKKFSFIMTICLMTISTVLLYMAGAITFYNQEKIVKKYLEEYELQMLPVFMESTYTDDFFEECVVQLAKGKYFEKSVGEKIDEEATLVEAVFEKYVVSDEEQNSLDMTVLFVDVEFRNVELLKGSLPSQDDQVMITDYAADELGVSIGDVLRFNNAPVTVVGIVKTDYVEYNLKSKLHNGNSSPFLTYYLKYKYQVMYMQNSYLHDKVKSINVRIELPMSDFTVSNREKPYLESALFFDSAIKIKETDLLVGRLPERKNEVVVSDEFAANFLEYDTGAPFEERIYQFKNIYSEYYNNCYSDVLNLYDYYTDGIVVVGVVSNFAREQLCSEVYVEENMWSKIKCSYYDYFAANKIYLIENGDYEVFVEIISSNGAMIEEPAVHQIYEFAKVINKLRMILYAVLLLVSVLNVVMLITFIQISIRENKKNIGVLRALGVPMRETGSIFMIEFWGIYILSVIMSIPILIYIQNLANSIYSLELVENPYDIILWNSAVFIIVLIVEGIIDVFASTISIRKWNEKRIIELMRRG